MNRLELEYALPVTAFHFTGTVTTTTDVILGGESPPAASGTVATSVVAGHRRFRLKISGGLLEDTSVAFALTDDGRLTSAEVARTGQAGKALLGVVSGAAALASVVTGFAPAAGAIGAASQLHALTSAAEKEPAPEKPSPEERVMAAYKAHHPEEAELLTTYRAAVRKASIDLGAAATAALAPAGGSDAQHSKVMEMRHLERMLTSLRAQLAPLETQFSAWRAGTIRQRIVQHDRFVTLDSLRAGGVAVQDGEVTFGGATPCRDAEETWKQLGLAVTVDPLGKGADIDVSGEDDVIVVREPRVATISVWERDEHGKARLQRTVEQLVIDSASEWRTVKLDKSWFAKRSNSLHFSELGSLSGFSAERGATAAAVGETLGSLPGEVSGGLGQGLAIRTKLSELQSFGAEQQLANVKREVELAQQNLTKAGLTATTGNYGELERLKQQAEILAQQKTIGSAGLDGGALQLAALKQQVELIKAQAELVSARVQGSGG